VDAIVRGGSLEGRGKELEKEGRGDGGWKGGVQFSFDEERAHGNDFILIILNDNSKIRIIPFQKPFKAFYESITETPTET
jgi:hypothetical protein